MQVGQMAMAQRLSIVPSRRPTRGERYHIATCATPFFTLRTLTSPPRALRVPHVSLLLLNPRCRVPQVSLLLLNPRCLRVPLDKNEGVVKARFSWAVRKHRLVCRQSYSLRTKTLETSLANHYRWSISFHQPSIRPLTSAMILPCEHPAAGPVRKWKTALPFSKARTVRRLLHGPVWMRERPINSAD